MKRLLPVAPTALALVGALCLLIALGSSQGPQAALAAPAGQGNIAFVRVDADPDASGIQSCRSVAPGETFSVDFVVDSINAADSNNFAIGGNVGFNFSTGDFTSPTIDFEPGALDEIAGFTPTPQLESTTKTPNMTHVGRAFFSSPDVSAPGLVGQVIGARATLTAGNETGLKTISITKSDPLDGGFDFFMGASPTVQPTNIQSATIAVGVDCPSDGAPDSAPPDSAPDSAPSGGTPIPGGPQTITLTTAAPEGDCPSNFTIVEGPSNGTLGEISSVRCSEGVATATVLYTPDDGFSGSDSFTFGVADGDAEPVRVSVLVGAEGEATPDATPAGGADTTEAGDTEEPIEEPSDGGGTNWTLIIIIVIVVVAAAAAAAGGAWWRLRGRTR